MEKSHRAAVPPEWLWFDLIAAGILMAIIAVDWFFVPYERDKELNLYCYIGISAVAILGLIYSYLYQIDYIIEY
jgi:hypothetical protein